jgi:predicted aspartyl protease
MNRWLFSLACLSLFFPSSLQADENTQLPFRLSSGYLIQVEGRIGDHAHLKFLLDTGATISIVSKRMAQKLKLETQPTHSFSLFDQSFRWETAIVPEVQFGPIRVANVTALVGDLASYSEFASAADAIIGMDLLRLSNWTIDFGARHLIFAPDPPEAYVAGGDPMAKCLIVEFQVQGHPVHLIVDTGVSGIFLYEDRVRRSVPALHISGIVRNATMDRQLQVKQGALSDVVLGSRKREVSVVFLPEPGEDVIPGIDGLVGIDAFQARRVRFNFSGKTLSWE